MDCSGLPDSEASTVNDQQAFDGKVTVIDVILVGDPKSQTSHCGAAPDASHTPPWTILDAGKPSFELDAETTGNDAPAARDANGENAPSPANAITAQRDETDNRFSTTTTPTFPLGHPAPPGQANTGQQPPPND